MSEKVCFVICPIGDEGSEIRNWSDLVFEFIISPVVKELGYKPIRPHEIEASGWVTGQIIDLIVNADLVIADLTNHNPNVFYELAIRHVIKKPCIEMIRNGQQMPFDIKGMRTVNCNIDLRSVDAAKRALHGHIKSINEGTFKEDNPITLSQKSILIEKRLEEGLEAASIPENQVILESLKDIRSIVLSLKQNEESVGIARATKSNVIDFHTQAGTVTGRAIVGSSSIVNGKPVLIGLANADAYLVNASNLQNIYYKTITTPQGFFAFNNVKLSNGEILYRILITDTTFGYGISAPFLIKENDTINFNVEVKPISAHLKLYGDKPAIRPDRKDFAVLGAYVTDPLNNIVSDGTHIRFVIESSPDGSGSLLEIEPGVAQGTALNIDTKDGYAKLKFGFTKKPGVYSIKAFDIEHPTVYDVIKVTVK